MKLTRQIQSTLNNSIVDLVVGLRKRILNSKGEEDEHKETRSSVFGKGCLGT